MTGIVENLALLVGFIRTDAVKPAIRHPTQRLTVEGIDDLIQLVI